MTCKYLDNYSSFFQVSDLFSAISVPHLHGHEPYLFIELPCPFLRQVYVVGDCKAALTLKSPLLLLSNINGNAKGQVLEKLLARFRVLTAKLRSRTIGKWTIYP
jgi:hypothetical protein